MARSRNEISGTWPLIGTSDATGATAVGVKGGTLVPRKGSGKTKDPTRQSVGRRTQTRETAGAQFKVTASRAYADANPLVGKNVKLLPASHTQHSAWRGGFDGLGPEPN